MSYSPDSTDPYSNPDAYRNLSPITDRPVYGWNHQPKAYSGYAKDLGTITHLRKMQREELPKKIALADRKEAAMYHQLNQQQQEQYRQKLWLRNYQNAVLDQLAKMSPEEFYVYNQKVTQYVQSTTVEQDPQIEKYLL